MELNMESFNADSSAGRKHAQKPERVEAGGLAVGIREWLFRVKPLFASPRYLVDVSLSAVFLYSLGMGIMYWILEPIYASLPLYPVPDRVLAILPTINLNYPSAYTLYSVAAIFCFWVIWRMPEKIPFIMKIFMVMGFSKHLISPITNFTQPLGAIKDFAYDNIYNDLFFSGHVAMTFFCFLIMRKNTKWLKYVILAGCVFEAASVLLMKLHYTIDVIAAPFIAFGIFCGMGKLLEKNKKRYEGLIKDKSRILEIG
jgi:membrane-associated phospholipid phosphatase